MMTLSPGWMSPRLKLAWAQARRAKAASDWHDATPDEMTIPSTIGHERETNPFMRVDAPELIESVRKVHPEAGTDPVEILGHVRAMKDRF